METGQLRRLVVDRSHWILLWSVEMRVMAGLVAPERFGFGPLGGGWPGRLREAALLWGRRTRTAQEGTSAAAAACDYAGAPGIISNGVLAPLCQGGATTSQCIQVATEARGHVHGLQCHCGSASRFLTPCIGFARRRTYFVRHHQMNCCSPGVAGDTLRCVESPGAFSTAVCTFLD